MRKLIKSLLISIGVIVGIVIIYVVYMQIQFYRIEDNLDLTSEIKNNKEDFTNVILDNEYTITTYNIGFGAYTRDFSFFMDSGVMKDGKKVTGTGSRAKSKQVVLENTSGVVEIMEKQDADFMLFQEVDINSTRSYGVNQYEILREKFDNFGSVFASNFHSAFLFYPIFNPHGKTRSGIATFSKYKINSVLRRRLPIDEGFLVKFFDLDRTFTISRINVENGKELLIINIHMSAYDEGGIYRKKQLELLNSVLNEEKNKGNYVVVGGDFNHDIANSLTLFPSEQYVPEWVNVLKEEDIASGFRIAASNLYPTCRSTDIPYKDGINYTVVLDGFIVSDNIDVISIENIVSLNGKDINFLYSDHNPVKMKFVLKG